MCRRKTVSQLTKASRGQTMVEYALILVTIAAIAVALVQNAGVIIETLVGNVSSLL